MGDAHLLNNSSFPNPVFFQNKEKGNKNKNRVDLINPLFFKKYRFKIETKNYEGLTFVISFVIFVFPKKHLTKEITSV